MTKNNLNLKNSTKKNAQKTSKSLKENSRKTGSYTSNSKKTNDSNNSTKQVWKAGNMVYPIPAVMVSCAGKDGKNNILTVAWTGTICTDPAMVYISVRPERYSYNLIKETREFVINLTTADLVKQTDYCGVKSGRDVDKFKELRLTPVKANKVNAPLIKESPVNIECKVKEIRKLGSHDMFIAEVVCVNVDENLLDGKDKFHLNDANLMVYSHGDYYEIGKKLGTFGYSVKKKGGKSSQSKITIMKEKTKTTKGKK